MAKPVGLFLAGLALAACVPAPALAGEQKESKAEKLSRQLDDPMTQYAVAGALAAVAKQMLEMKVEPFVRGAEEATGRDVTPDIPPDTTVGDLAGPEARQVPKQIMRRVPKLMGSLADIANTYGDMLPELEDMAKRMKDAVPKQ